LAISYWLLCGIPAALPGFGRRGEGFALEELGYVFAGTNESLKK
jgi:hypothetical protein